MSKITIIREDTPERILSLALAKGYKTEIETEETVIVDKPTEDGGTVPFSEIVKGMIPNKETPEQFIGKFYSEIVDGDITSTFLEIAKADLAEARQAEDEALVEGVKTSVGVSEIIIN